MAEIDLKQLTPGSNGQTLITNGGKASWVTKNVITIGYDAGGPQPGTSVQSIGGVGQTSLFQHISGSKLFPANTLLQGQVYEFEFWGTYNGAAGGSIAVPSLSLFLGPSLPYAANAALFTISGAKWPLDTNGAAGTGIALHIRGQFLVGAVGVVFSSDMNTSFIAQTQYGTNTFTPGNIAGFSGSGSNKRVDTTVANNLDLVVSWSATTPSNTMYIAGGFVRLVNQ